MSSPDFSAILSRYRLGELVEWSALGGASKSTYRVVTTERALVLKVYAPPVTDLEHIRLQIRVMEHLAAAHFPSPRPLPGNDGAILQPFDEGWVYAMEWLEGMTAANLTLTPALVGDIGRMVAAFRRAMIDFQVPTPSPLHSFIEISAKNIETLRALQNPRPPFEGVKRIIPQWTDAQESLQRHQADLASGVIHGDLWPPNVMCVDERVSGLIDFDGCMWSATFVDVALALMEFSMFQRATLDLELANAFLIGYFQNGGTLTPSEQARLVDAMTLACAMWLTGGLIEREDPDEAEAYLARLDVWSVPHARAEFCSDLDELIAHARALA